MDRFSKATSRKYNALKANTPMTSAKASSKIPFLTPKDGSHTKAPSYTPSPGAKHLGLRVSQPNTASPPEPKTRPLTLNKPLPSPPVAQVVNPSSPPKVSRTLMDATVAGTPTTEQYPVLLPENVEEVDNVKVHELPAEPLEPEQIQIHQSVRPVRSELLDIPEDDSPLVRKHVRNRAMITPRNNLQFETRTPSLSPAPVEPPSSSGSGMSQLSGTNRGELNMSFHFPAPSPRRPTRRYVRPLVRRDINIETASSVYEQREVLRAVSDGNLVRARSLSRSPMGESAGDGDSESGTRVKRLSSQSQASASGLGMVLTIADDADVVIMGHQRGTPEVPSVPDVVPEPEETQPRSLSALAGRLSRKKGHASLFAHSRPRTAPTPNPTLHEHTLVEEFMKQNGTMQAEVNTMRDDMKLIAEISEQPSKPPASQMMKQTQEKRRVSSPPPVPPKDSVRDTSRIPAPQLLAERAIYTAPRVEPICPTTAKSSSTVAPTSGTKSRRPTPTITETRATATPQVKLKKSLRKLFHREDKGTSKPAARAPAVESQRPSQITSSCPRVPSSATVSKAEVPDKTETEPTRCKSEKHISRVQQLREHDTEHKRAVETVDSMVACIEHSKEARTAAAQAEMFAKKAEAHAAASQASLQKFLELAGSGPDPEVIGSFMGLFRNAGLTPPSIE